jgi:allantoicase
MDLTEAHDLPDLAARSLGGSVVAANDEFFAAKENLIEPAAPRFQPQTFTAKGQVYDGWETRRRREPGHDWVIIALGVPGVVRRAVVDTAFFRGNYPPRCSIEATAVDGYPSPAELQDAEWVPLLPETALSGDTRNAFDVPAAPRSTHVRLSIYPDGGVARLRLHGEPLPDPRELAGLPLDLVALANGGRAVACSDSFFSPPGNMLQPGESRFMGDGWETARRRDDGNDWAVLRLAAQARPAVVELSTLHYKGNAPASAALSGMNELDDPDLWFPLLEPTRLQPDTRHRFRLADAPEVTHVRLDIRPDGGIARFRLYGEPTERGWDDLTLRWFNALPPAQARRVLAMPEAEAVLAARPLTALPSAVAELVRRDG